MPFTNGRHLRLITNKWAGRFRRSTRDQRGALLIEALVAITVFTLMGAAVLAAMSTTHRASGSIEASAVAENIARNQIETVLAASYRDPYHDYATEPDLMVSTPGDYGVTAEAKELTVGDPNVARIVVEVTRGGVSVLKVEVLRLKEE